MKIAVYLFLVFFAVILSSCAVESRSTWRDLHEDFAFSQYVTEFHKIYSDAHEYQARKDLFQQQLKVILQHNRDTSKSWKMGINHLTDRTEAEKRKLLGYRKDLAFSNIAAPGVQPLPFHPITTVAALPSFVDWREKNVVTAVKDQGNCGSCWTFAAAESIESHYAIYNKDVLPTISEQHILSCTPNPEQCGGTGGCAGGTAELAFSTLIQNGGGISSEWVYPYLSYRGNDYSCSATVNTPIAANVSGYVKLPSNQYEPVMNALATRGPLAIAVDASLWSNYESGIFTACNATSVDINHGVLLVGYGSDSSHNYWYTHPLLFDHKLIRNSWAPTWGEAGYIRVARSTTPTCGTDSTPLDGTTCKGGPSQVSCCGECGILFDVSFPIIFAA